ncbi:MAG TPA: phage holin family protein [Candidatus Angelobacter sp.]|nr:phage holin family protein [Candidatus Angelobacter sp.]
MPFEKSFAASLAELKDDLKNFVQTRIELLRAEISETLSAWKGPALLFAIAALMLLSSWFAMVFTLVAVLHSWIARTDFGWFWAGLIVTLFMLLAGVSLAAAGYAGLESKSLKPKRTLRVLKQDQEWVQKQRTA